jgi:hypothetical protein
MEAAAQGGEGLNGRHTVDGEVLKLIVLLKSGGRLLLRGLLFGLGLGSYLILLRGGV